jgi:non-homologous end joining protein Ku
LAVKTTPPRAVLSGVTISFGILMARVDLVPVQLSKATRAKSNISTTNLCPNCEGNIPLKSQLWCEHGHGPFSTNDARKGVTVDGELKATTDEAVVAAKAPSIPEKKATLSVFHADDVEAATMPSGNMFRLRTDPSTTYGLLLELVDDRSLAFVCEMVVKGKTCLYRAVAHGGTIVLAELVRPERMNPFEPVEVDPIDERVLANARRLAHVMVEEFVPGDWADERQARLEELGASEPVDEERNSDVKTATADLVAMLEATKAA